MKPAFVNIRRARPLLGTFVEIAVGGSCRSVIEEAVEAAFAAVAEAHRLMSVRDPASDVARLNRKATTRAVRVHPWTFAVLEAAIELHDRTAGAFDIAAPALQNRAQGAEIELCSGLRARFLNSRLTIDLGGIAKGFAVDRAIAALRDRGIAQALVNAGGDLAAYGPDPAPVAVRDPRDPRRILCHTGIVGEAIASSGPRLDPFAGEIRTTAVIDPRTSGPACLAIGATVRAPRCMIADALTKVVMIMGDAAAAILSEYGASALFVTPEGDLRVTGDWQSAVQLAA